MKKGKNIRTFKLIRNIIIVIIALFITLFILKTAPNYKDEEITGRTNIIINSGNVTAYLKKDVLVKDGIVYLSRADIDNFFDPYIYYDEENARIVTTYGTKVASLIIDNSSITINGKEYTLSAPAINEDNIVYLPISLMGNVYNTETQYIENTDTVVIETLSKEKITATATKNISVKSRTKTLSRTLDKVKKSDTVVVMSTLDNGWVKIRTQNGKIGYVPKDVLSDATTVREQVEEKAVFEGKVNMVWDYYSEYVTAPDRSGTTIQGVNVVSPTFFALERLGKGNIIDKVGEAGQNYIKWAKSNNYQVWALLSNESMIETTSEIMNSYELRSKLIENIVNLAQKYNLDGINIDFEYMYDKDINLFTQFLVELHPRLKELNKVLSVDVTAPDGGENWSTCYNRNNIADNCDYIIFMAYDQYGNSSVKAGTTAGYDWVKLGLDKFLGREEIDANKIILAIPFYTRLWEETESGKLTSGVVDMRNINKVLPNGTEKKWLDDVKQYYVEYNKDGSTYKMWIEDERSIREKLSLVIENNLGGVAFWAKGREDNSIWAVIDETLN